MNYFLNLKRLVFILFGLILSATAYSKNVSERIDSCRVAIAKQSGAEKLSSLQTMQTIALYSEFELELEIALAFEAEAIGQNNVEMIGLAKYRKVSLYSNYGEIDKAIELAETEMEECRKVGAMKSFYQLLNLKGEFMLFQGKPLAALFFIKPYFEQAQKENDTFGLAACADVFGQIYSVTGDLQSAEKFLLEAIQNYSLLGDNAVADKLNAYFKLSNVYFTDKKYTEIVELTRNYEALMDKAMKDGNKDERELRYGLCFFLRGMAAHYLGDKVLLRTSFDKMGQYTAGGQAFGELYSTLKMCVDAANGDFDAAQSYADTQIEIYRKNGMEMSTLAFIQHKADFYTKQRNFEQANQMLKEYIEIADKVRADESLQQQNEFASLYELEKKEAHSRLLTSWLVGIGISCLLLLVSLGLFIYFNRALRRRNRALCEQIEETSAAQRKMEQIKLQYTTIATKEEITLIDRLEELMLTERLYAKEEINRDSVASALGTNRTYLTNAIRETYSQTFPEYVTSLRLNAAIGLIELNKDTPDIQSIAEQVGYTSYTSFYRAFIKRYGVKPMDYVHFLKTKKISDIENE